MGSGICISRDAAEDRQGKKMLLGKQTGEYMGKQARRKGKINVPIISRRVTGRNECPNGNGGKEDSHLFSR